MPQQVVSTYRDVVASLTAEGGPFEMESVVACGRKCRAYRHAPAGLEEFFGAAESSFADRVLLAQEGRSHTFGEMFAEARRLAGSLRDEFGVRPGDRVGVAMRNRHEYFVSLFAVARAGAVAVLFNSRAAAPELGAEVDDVPCSVIVADETRAARLAESGRAPRLLVVREQGTSDDARDYARCVGMDRREADAAPTDRDAPAWVLFTSGTSGRAKGAVLTQRNVCNMLKNLDFMRASSIELAARQYGVPVETILEYSPTPSALLVYPMFHVSGLTNLGTALLGGGRLVGMRRWNPAEAARLIVEHKVTMVSGPPMVVRELLTLPDAPEFMSGVVQIGVGGQATPPNMPELMRKVVPNAAQGGGWGMTETVGSVCAATGPVADARPASAGRTSPLMDVRAVDPMGRPLPSGENGELQVRGVLVMKEYWDRPEATAGAFDGDWYRTGDIGHVDDDGYIHIVDRLTDMVISGGENVYCAEVENVLIASDRFIEVALFGVPDPRLGERAVAAVRLRDGVTLTAGEIQSLVGAALADYKVPAEVVFPPVPLPRTATGKIEKAKLRTAYLSSTGGSPGA